MSAQVEVVSGKLDAATAKALAVTQLSHRYGDRIALHPLDLSVEQGEMFGLLGPNGSGKTTLFRILSTLMLPTGGSAKILGADVASDAATVRSRIGVVFQSQSLDLKLTARENLRHQGHLFGMRGEFLANRIVQMLQRVGLSDRANESAGNLSGGMQRRLEIAKGLIHSPAVLILDEPTTGLDPGARKDVWQYLASLRASEGATVIVTTHLMDEAERCDRLAILHEGSLVAHGTPAELRSEIGGDVVTLESNHVESLATGIRLRFHCAARIMGNTVRVELPNGHHFAAEVVEAFRGEVSAVHITKPTLDDVFIHRTGHRFWWEKQS